MAYAAVVPEKKTAARQCGGEIGQGKVAGNFDLLALG